MAGYFEEMGWRELGEGEQPSHLLHMARYLVDAGILGLEMMEGNAEWHSLPPPASKEAVSKLPELTMEEEGKSCPICLKMLHSGQKAKQMPCQHMFHPTCILTWLAKTNSCPCCRHELPTEDNSYEEFKLEKKRAEERKKNIDALHDSMFS